MKDVSIPPGRYGPGKAGPGRTGTGSQKRMANPVEDSPPVMGKVGVKGYYPITAFDR